MKKINITSTTPATIYYDKDTGKVFDWSSDGVPTQAWGANPAWIAVARHCGADPEGIADLIEGYLGDLADGKKEALEEAILDYEISLHIEEV